ncbi:hypothetical protein LP7551_04934 [Roseibium album]|nr:hypothetical protein LP7551_04934 [Roseibium album]
MSESAVTDTPPPVEVTLPPEIDALTSLSISLIAPATPKLIDGKLVSVALKSFEIDIKEEVSEAETRTPSPEDGDTMTVLSTMLADVLPVIELEANLDSEV